MKLKIVIASILISCIKITYSQSIGVKGGLNIASIDYKSNPGSVIGYHIGPIIDFQIQKNFFLSTGLQFSLNGVEMGAVKENGDIEIVPMRIRNLQLPVDFKILFLIDKSNKLFMQAGPYVGYSMSNKVKQSSRDSKINYGDQGLTRFDFGIEGAIGFEFGRIVPSLGYQYGITDQFGSNDLKGRNRVVQVSLAYIFATRDK